MSKRIHTLGRRELLRWVARTSAGLAGMSLLGGCADDAPAVPGADAALPGADAALPGADAAPPGADAAACPASTSDVLGPYYLPGAPSRMTIASATEPGERLHLEGILTGPDCAPLAGALLDVWQSDKDGTYYQATGTEPFRLRGTLMTAADGTWQLDTIRPGNYMLGAASWRPAHIHFTISQPGFRTLTTQIYFAGDPFLPPNDGCTNCGSDDPARIVPLVAGGTGQQGSLALALARA